MPGELVAALVVAPLLFVISIAAAFNLLKDLAR